MEQMFARIDIHKDFFYGTILDKEGKVINESRFLPTKEGIATFFLGIPSSKIKATIEACGLWRGFYRIAQELGYEIILANPVKTKKGQSNDR